MKMEHLGEENHGDDNTSSFSLSIFCPTPEFERLFEWVRLNASHVRNNVGCVENHQQSLLALAETAKRLNAVDHWRESPAFTEREKAALSLSETISSQHPAEFSLATLKAVRCHFSPEETVRLALAVMAVNDWIDLQEKGTPRP